MSICYLLHTHCACKVDFAISNKYALETVEWSNSYFRPVKSNNTAIKPKASNADLCFSLFHFFSLALSHTQECRGINLSQNHKSHFWQMEISWKPPPLDNLDKKFPYTYICVSQCEKIYFPNDSKNGNIYILSLVDVDVYEFFIVCQSERNEFVSCLIKSPTHKNEQVLFNFEMRCVLCVWLKSASMRSTLEWYSIGCLSLCVYHLICGILMNIRNTGGISDHTDAFKFKAVYFHSPQTERNVWRSSMRNLIVD